MLGGMIVVPNDDEAADLVKAYRAYVEQAPEQLVSALATVLAPPAPFVPPEMVGAPMLAIIGLWVGDPAEAEEPMRPLRALGEKGMDLMEPMPYTAFQAMLDDFAPKRWLNYHRGLHLSGLTDTIIDPYLEAGRNIGSPMTQGIIFSNGGAIARVPEDATATGSRPPRSVGCVEPAVPGAAGRREGSRGHRRRGVDRHRERRPRRDHAGHPVVGPRRRAPRRLAPPGLRDVDHRRMPGRGVVVVAAVPRARRWWTRSAVPSLRRSWTSCVEVIRSPRLLGMVAGGSAIVTISNLIAFFVSLRAFGVDVSFTTVGVVYLAGSALASAAPTPGGLGATEAALVAGLAVVGVSDNHGSRRAVVPPRDLLDPYPAGVALADLAPASRRPVTPTDLQ